MKTGGQLIVEALEANGVDRLYCVPGESFLAVLDALHDSPIRTIVCRQEGGAAMMADCHGKLTGKPGICFVTRGPGATNASAGIHIAMQDSTPVILFIGQIARRIRDREAFQEVDYRQLLRRRRQMGDRDRRPGARSRTGDAGLCGGDLRPSGAGRRRAARGRADRDGGSAGSPAACAGRDAAGRARARPARGAARQGRAPDRHSRRHRAGRPTAVASFQKSAEAWSLPVGCSFRRQMLFDHLHPNYAGDVGIGINPKLATYIKQVRPGAADRRPARRDAVVGLHAAEEPLPRPDSWCMSIPTPANSAASTARRSPSTPRRRHSPRLSPGASRPRRPAGQARRQGCTPPISTGRRRRKPVPDPCRWGRS